VKFLLAVMSLAFAGASYADTPDVVSAGIPVSVTLDTTLTTKTAKVGDQFSLIVTQDVDLNGRVVVPHGSKGEGHVIWRTGNGGYGKSGKLEIEFTKVFVNGAELPLTGKFREAGKGRPGAVLFGGMLLKGNEAVIEKGRALTAYLLLPATR
jgi:hypothetical protein